MVNTTEILVPNKNRRSYNRVSAQDEQALLASAPEVLLVVRIMRFNVLAINLAIVPYRSAQLHIIRHYVYDDDDIMTKSRFHFVLSARK